MGENVETLTVRIFEMRIASIINVITRFKYLCIYAQTTRMNSVTVYGYSLHLSRVPILYARPQTLSLYIFIYVNMFNYTFYYYKFIKIVQNCTEFIIPMAYRV